MPDINSKDLSDPKEENTADDVLVKIALSRGIFFPAAEIFHDKISGTWDYGPIGVLIFNNLVNEWRKTLSEMGGVEISGSVILPRAVLQASGHESNFFDVAVVCSKCGTAYRVDKLLEEKEPSRNYEGLSDEDYLSWINFYAIRCNRCSGELNKIKKFGSMLGLSVGLQNSDEKEINAYLRPEACQSIFLDFKRVFSLYGKRLPLIIGQVGKAFRNEISPRNNLLRQREFYQNDIEIFFDDDNSFNLSQDKEINIFDKKNPNTTKINISEALSSGVIKNKVTAFALSNVAGFLEGLGFDTDHVRYRKLYEDRAFYSKESFDVEINKGGDWVEAIACNHRGDYDLTSYGKGHADTIKINGKVPNVFEISAGTDRLFYLALYLSIKSDKERTWFALNNRISPFKAAIFPLLSKEELDKIAKDALNNSAYRDSIYYLRSGSIGKMYRKSDEIGIPIAFTIDYQTLKDGTVTIRDRDTMAQFRVELKNLDQIIKDSRNSGFKSLKGKFELH
jgi:glycyl-tRNA synthetase